jgi:hypothetical protein
MPTTRKPMSAIAGYMRKQKEGGAIYSVARLMHKALKKCSTITFMYWYMH